MNMKEPGTGVKQTNEENIDTKEEISLKVQELKDQVFAEIEDTNPPPEIYERINQIFNDALASIPADPQEPKFQRATVATTITKIKEQLSAAAQSFGGNKQATEKFMAPIETAEKEAKQEDEKKGTAQPAGPSQSQEQSRLKDQAEQAEHNNKKHR